MLSSDLNSEMGTLIRSLEAQVRQHPELLHSDVKDVLDAFDRLLVTLISCRVALKQAASQQKDEA